MKFLQSGWIICLIGCATYLGCTLAFLNPKSIQPVQAKEPHEDEEHKPVPVLTGPSWEFNNPEVDQIIGELRAEKLSLQEKIKQVNEMSNRLKAEQRELMAATQAVHRLQLEFDRSVARVKEEEVANLKRLAKLYATMTPESAAGVLKHLDDEQMIKILVHMKESEVAPVLEILSKQSPDDAKRVALLSERLRLVLLRPTPGGK